MIEPSRQLGPAPKRTEKRIRKDEHAQDIKAIHARGAEVLPAEYLVTHQSEQESGHKVRALAKQRIAIRNAKRAFIATAAAASTSTDALNALGPAIASRSVRAPQRVRVSRKVRRRSGRAIRRGVTQ